MDTISESSKYLILGNVDAGKSSFISVMEKNVLDDGNGYARNLITRVKHEQTTGRTSTHSFHYIVKNNKITTMIDLCGHEKYFKTTMFGVMGLFGNYGILIIGSNMGISVMTHEHLSLLVVRKIPFIIVITKIDICPASKLDELRNEIKKIIKRAKKIGVFVDETKQNEKISTIVKFFENNDSSLVPIIEISCKTGSNVDLTRNLITQIDHTSNKKIPNISPDTTGLSKLCNSLERSCCNIENTKRDTVEPVVKSIIFKQTVFYIDSIYNVVGIGIVLSGTVLYGDINIGKKMYLGPINGTYITVTIKSIQNCIRTNVDCLKQNESGSVGIRLENKNAYDRKMFRKGQIICSDKDYAIENTCYSFSCDVVIFNHTTTIQNGYQTVVHSLTVRQNARFIISDNTILRSNSKEKIKIKFVQRPEFILPGSIFAFRDGKTKGFGKIIETTNFKMDEPDKRQKRRKTNLK